MSLFSDELVVPTNLFLFSVFRPTMIKFLTPLLFLVAGAKGCSIFCELGSNSFGSSIVRSNVVVRAWIQKDISPSVDPLFSWVPRLYQGSVTEVFKGQQNVTKGRLTFSGAACGTPLPTRASVLLFGDIQHRKIDNYAAPMPVFVPTSCTSVQLWNSLTDEEIARVRDYDSLVDPCIPEDCADLEQPPAFMISKKLCSDGTAPVASFHCAEHLGQCNWVSSPASC